MHLGGITGEKFLINGPSEKVPFSVTSKPSSEAQLVEDFETESNRNKPNYAKPILEAIQISTQELTERERTKDSP